MENYKHVFIPGNVPSLKNSKIKTNRGIFSSKTVQKYLRNFGIKSYSSSKKIVEEYKTIPMTFPVKELKELFDGKNTPIILALHFYRGTKHTFDFNNGNQLVLDLLTAFDIIDDDNIDNIIPVPLKLDNKWYSYSKENPGIYITIAQDIVLTF